MGAAEDIAWVAGVFEGEGTIRPRRSPPGKKHYGAQVAIRMDDQDVIEHIRAVMGFGNLYVVTEHRPSETKIQYNYQVARAEHVCAFLAAVAFPGRAPQGAGSGGPGKLPQGEQCEPGSPVDRRAPSPAVRNLGA
jgi:hypothetical protein